MNCQEVMEYMQRQLDDDLDEHENEVLINHTRHCPDCAAMFERLKLLSAELTSLPKVTPSYSLVDAILPQLERMELLNQQQESNFTESDNKPAEVLSRRKAQNRRWPSMKAMSGVLAASIVAGLFLVTYGSGNGPDLSKMGLFSADRAKNNADTASSPQSKMNLLTEDVNALSVEDQSGSMENRKSMEPEMASSQNGSTSDDKAKDLESGAQAPGEISDLGNNSGESNESPTQGFKGAGAVNGQEDAPLTGYSFDPSLSQASSPDGKYIAQVTGNKVIIFTAVDETPVLKSSPKNGTLENLVWSEDSKQLTYEVHLERAIEKYVLDLASEKEEKAAH